jgi:hypothetical protein
MESTPEVLVFLPELGVVFFLEFFHILSIKGFTSCLGYCAAVGITQLKF